jgi:hypothetical protein
VRWQVERDNASNNAGFTKQACNSVPKAVSQPPHQDASAE